MKRLLRWIRLSGFAVLVVLAPAWAVSSAWRSRLTEGIKWDLVLRAAALSPEESRDVAKLMRLPQMSEQELRSLRFDGSYVEYLPNYLHNEYQYDSVADHRLRVAMGRLLESDVDFEDRVQLRDNLDSIIWYLEGVVPLLAVPWSLLMVPVVYRHAARPALVGVARWGLRIMDDAKRHD